MTAIVDSVYCLYPTAIQADQRFMVYLYGYTLYKSWLTGIDEGRTHQGSWGRVGDVAGTAMSKTRVAVQSRGPGNTHREPTSSWAAPPYAYACGCVLANADKRLTIFNTYAHSPINP